MDKLSKRQTAIDILFKPDENGISNWIDRVILDTNTILNWGNNGIGRHGIFFGDKRYIWEKYPLKGKIQKLRLNGFSPLLNNTMNRPIRKDIKKYYKNKPCVVCGSKSDLVVDHKNDLYNDPRVLNIKTQLLDDFQSLCNHCNLQKRQIIKNTKKTGLRYGATNIPSLAVFGVDFIKGTKRFDMDDINAMVGTYWFDPVAFIKHLS